MKKIISVAIILFMFVLAFSSCGGKSDGTDNLENMQKQYVEEKYRSGYSHIDTIEACGFSIDNTEMQLLISIQDNGFFGFDDLEYINYGASMLSFEPSTSTTLDKEVEEARNNVIESNAEEVSEISDVDIDGCKCKAYTFVRDGYHYKEYVIEPDNADYLMFAQVQAFGEDVDKVAQMIESMKRIGEKETDTKSTEEKNKDNSSDTKSSDKKEESGDAKKREMSDMDEDEIFMAMALAEKEIKNNLTYDADKADFSHIPDNWYMSEIDGNYTIMTTFEAPNEYGTMQKAGAVVSFTVTSKSKDGWNYKNEDVYIEWKN